MRRQLGWFCLYAVVAVAVFIVASWALPRLEEVRRVRTPKIRLSPLQEHESHPVTRADLDRG